MHLNLYTEHPIFKSIPNSSFSMPLMQTALYKYFDLQAFLLVSLNIHTAISSSVVVFMETEFFNICLTLVADTFIKQKR
jgi:hypothetical protein